MRRVKALAAVIGATATLAACASVGHRPLDSKDDATDEGIRYYRASPYLVAHSDGKGGVITEVKFLPDLTKLMSARPKATLADVETTMSFEHGVLTSAAATGDATAVTKAITKAVEGLGTTFLSALANEAKKTNTYKVPPPVLYKIVVDGPRVYLLQATADENAKKPIEITLLPQKDK